MRLLLLILSLSSVSNTFAQDCPTIFVTHAQEEFDYEKSSLPGITELLSSKSSCSKTFFLINSFSPHFLPQELIDTGISLKSQAGEHDIVSENDRIIVTGGYKGQCHFMTIVYAIVNRMKAGIRRNTEILVPMNATYDSLKRITGEDTRRSKTLQYAYQNKSSDSQELKDYFDLSDSLARVASSFGAEISPGCISTQIDGVGLSEKDTSNCEFVVKVNYIK